MIKILYLFAWALFKTFKHSEAARPLGRFRSRGLESKVVNSTLADPLGDGGLQLCHGWCLWMVMMFIYCLNMSIYFIWCDIVIIHPVVKVAALLWFCGSKCVTRAPCRRASTMTEMTIRHPTNCDKRGGKVHQRPHASARHDKHLMSSKVLSSKPKMMVSQVVVASESLLEVDIWKENGKSQQS